jgi:hypothetical protein
MLADEVKVIKITSDVIPKPVSGTIKHRAVLFTVVVVRLVLAPSRLHDGITC